MYYHRPELGSMVLKPKEEFPTKEWNLKCEVKGGYPEVEYYWYAGAVNSLTELRAKSAKNSQNSRPLVKGNLYTYRLPDFKSEIIDKNKKFTCAVKYLGKFISVKTTNSLTRAKQSPPKDIIMDIKRMDKQAIIIKCSSKVSLPSKSKMYRAVLDKCGHISEVFFDQFFWPIF